MIVFFDGDQLRLRYLKGEKFEFNVKRNRELRSDRLFFAFIWVKKKKTHAFKVPLMYETSFCYSNQLYLN